MSLIRKISLKCGLQSAVDAQNRAIDRNCDVVTLASPERSGLFYYRQKGPDHG